VGLSRHELDRCRPNSNRDPFVPIVLLLVDKKPEELLDLLVEHSFACPFCRW